MVQLISVYAVQYNQSITRCRAAWKLVRVERCTIFGGSFRTKAFTKKLDTADNDGIKILLIHNHPRGLPPSLSDVNALMSNKNVSGITVGHDGSLYYYTRPEKTIPEDDFNIAMKHFNSYTEITAMEKTMELLSKKYGFKFEKL